MLQRRVAAVSLGMLAAIPLTAGEASAPSKWPEQDLARFVFEHLDISSFRNSTGPRRQPGQRTFKALGIRPTSVSADAAESDGDGWHYSIRVLGKADYNRDGTLEVMICFRDAARDGGSYFTESDFILQLLEGRAIALAYTANERTAAGCKTALPLADRPDPQEASTPVGGNR